MSRFGTRGCPQAGSRRTGWSLLAAGVVGVAGCLSAEVLPPEPEPVTPPPVGEPGQALAGENLGGGNLAGVNLGGANLGGTNLGGANLGGNNLGGANMNGNNLGGTNLGGNNLGGNNLGATNLGGVNLAGLNLGGSNLSGKNLASSNLGGSNLAGNNLGGNNLAGTNLGGSNLAGNNSGKNIHNLTSAITGMLYSGEDLWQPKGGQCVVFGIGSTAFPKLLGQQSASAKISVALGMLPWGFATTSRGPLTLRAWEAVVWGDRTYCVFVMAAPLTATWPGVAGFVKAVFRWNAAPAQTVEISGIEASLPTDPTVSSTIVSYTGMMNAGARWRAGNLSEKSFIAGELAFASATTNNQSVLVDFSSWVLDKNQNALVLGNVQPVNPPNYAEALYIALDNGDGSVSIILDDAASRATSMPPGMIDSVVDLNAAYLAWKDGIGSKPIPRRCGGALFLNTWFGEPVPAGKCDDGLTWSPGFCLRGASPWSTVSGTTGPMNSYMQLSQASGAYQRGQIVGNTCDTLKPVLSETYVHMWDKNYDLEGPCAPESDATFCARLSRNCGTVTDADNCGALRTVASCGACLAPQTCGGDGTPNFCAIPSTSYEAEAAGNTFSGGALPYACAEAFSKFGYGSSAEAAAGACSGGYKVRFLGNNSSNHVTVNNVYAATAGTYPMTVYAYSVEPRTFYISVNGGTARQLVIQSPGWYAQIHADTTVTLKAGNNSIRFFNNNTWAPDLDRILVANASGGGSTPPPAPPPPSGSACTFSVTKNSYDGSNWWGTVTFKNTGSASVSSYKVELDVPSGGHCTNDAVPVGAKLSPLTGSGSSAYTTSNRCVFTWTSTPLAAGASKTFNYSSDRQNFSAASNVKAGLTTCQ